MDSFQLFYVMEVPKMSGEWSGRVGRHLFRTPFLSVFPLLGFSCEHSLFYFVTKDEILNPSSGTHGCLTRLKTTHLASAYMNVEW